jgi:predicted Zn finger-like uncharacterized protein
MTASANPLYCPNGHGSPDVPGAQVCPKCGAAYVAAQAHQAAAAAPASAVFIPQFGTSLRQSQPFAPAPPAPPAAPQPAAPAYGQQPPGAPVPSAPAAPKPPSCTICGGEGVDLDPKVLFCPQCRWLRPLAPGYILEPGAFQSGADNAATAKLRTIAPLMAAARTVSDRVGRRWVETSFNAIRLGEDQLPEVFAQGVRAARLLAMPYMPDVYVSGDSMWEAVTYGSDRSAFLLIGTALINSFRGDDLLFVLGREMGHCRAGHALWKTVREFLIGQPSQQKGMMSQGILSALNPHRLIEGAIEVPFMNWARQAEITADRAGMLAVRNEESARRVLLAWSLRSVPLYRQINIQAWLQQQEDSDEQTTRIAEMLSSPTPFVTRRLKQLTQFAESPELAALRARIDPLDPPAVAPASAAAPVPPVARAAPAPAVAVPVPADIVRVKCPSCGSGIRIPRSQLAGKETLRVRCPKPECGKVLTMKKKSATSQNA